jgi:flagellin-like protein
MRIREIIMRRITKVKRSIRAISPVIATLLMIAIAVVASLVVYAWVIGYIGGATTKASNSMLIQSTSHATGPLVIYVQNVGQGTLQLRKGESVYVNSVLQNIDSSTPELSATGIVEFSPTTTASLTTDYTPNPPNEKLKIKITATDGTFAEYTTSGISTVSVGTLPTWPKASFTMSNSYPDVGQFVNFADTSVKGTGTINQWSWTFGDGAISSDQNPSHSYTTRGAKTVTLMVTDTNSRTATTTHTLIVSDFVSPTASFSWTITNLVVSFTDTSSAGSGTITGRTWTFTGGSPATSSSPTQSVTYSSAGQKTVSLTVTNSNGKQSTTTRTVNVAVDAPTAEFTISDPNPDVGQTITFTDASTSGSTGTIDQWSWSFGDTTTSTTQNPTHSYSTPGTRTITLTVTASNGGGSSTASHTITVNDYTPPIASFTFTPATPTVDQTVSFTDTSSAGSGSITGRSWSFGDGVTSTTQNPTHAYSSSGQKTVTLTVTDSNSRTSSTTQTITVSSTTPSNEVIFILVTPSSATAGSAFSITLTAKDESGNTITNYAGTVHLTSTDGQAVLPGDSTLNSGTKTFTVTLKTTGFQTISASDGTVTTTSGLIKVNPFAASQLVYTAGTTQSLTINQVSSIITVQRQDQYSNPTISGDMTVSLSSTATSTGRFYSDAGGTQQISAVTISDGYSSANFYYKDGTSGTPTLTASSSGLSVTTQFTINDYKLVFRNGAGQTLPSGAVSAQIRIQRQNPGGSSYSPSVSLIVQLTSTSGGKFYSESSATTEINSVTIDSGSHSSSYFYYKDTSQGSSILTASAQGYTPAITTFTITGPATQLKFTAGASQSLSVNQVSSIITVTQQDPSGNGVNAADALTVDLSQTSATGAFYNNGQGTGSSIDHVTIAQGSTSASFFYKDTAAGSSTITASSTGLTSATTTFTITANQVPDGGFDQSNNSPWHSSGSGYSTNHETSDTAPNNWGPYAELETVPPGYSETGFGALTNTFSPAIAISSIPNAAGSLSMMIYNTGYNNGELGGTGYYSFQIVLTASDGTQLIYWWGSNPATAPTQTSTVKVINWGTIQGTFTEGQWVQFTRNLRADWTNAGLSTSTALTSIILRADGYRSGGNQYGLEIFIDNVAIQ